MRRGLSPRKSASGRVAVLALDLLTDFDFPDGARVMRALARRAAAIRELLARARKRRVPVIYANDNLGPWRSDAPGLIAHCTDPRLPGAKLIGSLAPALTDAVILKPRHSAFFGTPLAALLGDQRVDTLIVSGISAESCVWMTACDAHTRGFNLIVPTDTIAGASQKALRATLIGLRDVLGGRVPARAASLQFKRGKA